ncbi:MAG: hypothetical protein QNJ53_28395 [Pleurocapsa sp. MO_192.B19]|nr:hypothetical protein [Pleurocapsa sp. MO_192.B19]
MIQASIDWNKDLVSNPKEEYQSLVRSLMWTDKFGLLFVRCSPARGDQLIRSIREDIPQKEIDILRLKNSIDNLYDLVDNLPNRDKLNILFITGIEKSFNEYIKPGRGGEGNFYKEDSVPRILGHLNLQRERFRDNFNICFVFLLRLYGLKYFIRRAPDFFDWRSGIFDFDQHKVSVTIDIGLEKYKKLESRADLNSKTISAIAEESVSLYLTHQEIKDECK